MNKPMEMLEGILLRYDKSMSTMQASNLLDTIVTEIEQFLGVTADELQSDSTEEQIKEDSKSNFISNFKEMEQLLGVMAEHYQQANAGEQIDQNNKSYFICTCTDSDFYIPNAVHVERNDALMLVEDDQEASFEAAKDGIQCINDMDGVPPMVYVDTPENREVIKQMLEQYPEYKKHGKKSYVLTVQADTDYYIPGALHVECNNTLKLVEDDHAASLEAEKDGIRLIYDMDGVAVGTYVDTPQNRAIILEMVEKYPKYKKYSEQD